MANTQLCSEINSVKSFLKWFLFAYRGYFAFLEAGRRHRVHRVDGASRVPRASIHAPNDSIIRLAPLHNIPYCDVIVSNLHYNVKYSFFDKYIN